MQNAGRGIWRKFSGLSRERRDGWSPYFQHMTYMDIANTVAKQKGEEGGEDESEEGQSSECGSHSMALQWLLDCMSQREFKHSDIIAARKIWTAVRSLNCSQK
jgi:hypothetical protein